MAASAPQLLLLLLGCAHALVAVPPISSDKLYLGIDLSTQSCTGVLLDRSLTPVRPAISINFDDRLPEFGTSAGMCSGEGGVVTSPVRMWLCALDALLGELKDTGLLGDVAATSVSGQQHGSVYWTAEGLAALEGPASGASGFSEALPDAAFSITDCPIWADSSTAAECAAIEEAFTGGAAAVARLTGSRAYERFTGPQMLAIAKRYPEAWASTSKVSLVSSFCASLLAGSFVPMDYSDASGTLLMDVQAREWAPEMLECAPFSGIGLADRLGGAPLPSHAVVGTVSSFLAERWGFDPKSIVVASSGDNPCAIAGLGLAQPGDLALSLGTSDTLLGVAPAATATPAVEGHVMAHPTDPASIFGMLCYKNGGAARQAVRDTHCAGEWSSFDAALREAPPGNGGILGLYLPSPEITPIISRTGSFHVDSSGKGMAEDDLSSAESVRAVVEGRFLSMRARGGAIGLKGAQRVLATGGGSQSSEILQVCADVFNAKVLAADTPDAAAVGAARRAAHAHVLAVEHDGSPDGLPYEAFLRERASAASGDGEVEELEVMASPSEEAAAVYDEAFIAKYKSFEDRVAAGEL